MPFSRLSKILAGRKIAKHRGGGNVKTSIKLNKKVIDIIRQNALAATILLTCGCSAGVNFSSVRDLSSNAAASSGVPIPAQPAGQPPLQEPPQPVPVAPPLPTATPAPLPAPTATPAPAPSPTPVPECYNASRVGGGTQADPYQINSVCDFKLMKTALNAYWKVMQTIDFSTSLSDGSVFIVDEFRGHFDGGQKHILNFTINCFAVDCSGSKDLALVKSANGADFHDVILTNVSISAPKINGLQNVAGLVGHSLNSNFDRILVEALIAVNGDINENGLFGVGAVVGKDSGGLYQEVDARLHLKNQATPYAVGAVAGSFCNAMIKNSKGEANIKNVWMSGGLVGGCGSGGTTMSIQSSYFVGSVDYFNAASSAGVALGWRECSYLSGLGNHELYPGNKASIENSFWIGSSNCSNLQSPPLTEDEGRQATAHFDSTIWATIANQLPELKWSLGVQ
jgi:hypothetical protein